MLEPPRSLFVTVYNDVPIDRSEVDLTHAGAEGPFQRSAGEVEIVKLQVIGMYAAVGDHSHKVGRCLFRNIKVDIPIGHG